MSIFAYALIAVGTIAGLALGWFFRHKVLDRQLFQTRKQLDDMKALHMNLEHEVSSVRQRLIQQEDSQANMKSMLQQADSQQKRADEVFMKLEEMQERLASIQQDNEELEEQVAYLEAEKSNLQKFREQAQEKMQQVAAENRQLREMVSELQQSGSRAAGSGSRAESAPVVRRIPSPEVTPAPAQKREKSEPSTSPLKTRQAESTDRVKTKEATSEIPSRAPSHQARQAPTSAIPVRQADTSGHGETDPKTTDYGRGTIKHGTAPVAVKPAPAEPLPEPVPSMNADWEKDAENEYPVDEDTGVGTPKKEPAVTRPGTAAASRPKKKKPRTVRIDRSTSDIMDSFKKDLGLPGK